MHNNPYKRRSLFAVTLLVVLGVFAAACGDDSGATDSSDTTIDANSSGDTSSGDTNTMDDTSMDGLEGEYLVSGSSTVFPIVQQQAEEFAALAPGVAITVEGPGSGDGAKKFCAGEAPIANASRLFKDEEIEICEANGIEFIEIRRGIDGISVITSSTNDAIECVSFNDLYALLSEEAFGFESWADANALTSGWGGTTFPDAPLDVFAPGEESGTYDSFGEIVIESVASGKTGLDPEAREFVETIRPDYAANANDNVIIEGIAASQYSLGWVGYAFAHEAAEAGDVNLLAVSVEDGGECVTPTPETIADASFPIARFLYTYVNAEAAATDPSVAAFVDYMMSDVGLESVRAVGYVDLAASDQVRAQAVWNNRLVGAGQWE
ncbi:MAG: substrate-binding domain-containing protein [Acidimicrobiales bacterium]